MSDKLLDDKIKDVEAKFTQLQEAMNTIQEQVNEGNRQLASRKEELIRLQGEYRVLKELKGSEETPKKEEKKPEKK